MSKKKTNRQPKPIFGDFAPEDTKPEKRIRKHSEAAPSGRFTFRPGLEADHRLNRSHRVWKSKLLPSSLQPYTTIPARCRLLFAQMKKTGPRYAS